MAQINTLFSAICKHGKTNVQIAHAMGVTAGSVSKWLSGINQLPVRRREAFERAVGVENIDWFGYEQELAAAQGGAENTRPHQEVAPPAPPPDTEKRGFWGSIWDDEGELDGA